MIVPSATYRLQFRNGMTFDRAIDVIPHLTALGISHLYASPIFAATTGSSHGYDIIDANAIDPALGGREGFDRLVEALNRAGLGLILDIVPNHMAASIENAWWQDVLRHGKTSRYAEVFDIDWSERLTLPVLGQPLQAALAAGELEVVRHSADGTLNLKYFDALFPLDPQSVLALEVESLRAANDDQALQQLSGDSEQLHQLLERQHWQLICWKEAAQHLSYRRFFEITGLVGVRVEEDDVFRQTHGLIVELVKAGQVQGLRIDHIDGLADPAGYLDRLRSAVGEDIFITVEKILGAGEDIPSRWPVAGTTGYEFISAMSNLFIDGDGLRDLQKEYGLIDAQSADFQKNLRAAKQLMVERHFEGEVGRLTRLASAVAPDIEHSKLTDAVRQLLIAFPVYRTYGHDGPLGDQDTAVLDTAIAQARQHVGDQDGLDLLGRLMRGEIGGAAAFEFRTRFQQMSGPVMAKAMEDTLFYRQGGLLAANEVGGDPGLPPGGVEAFHRAMMQRLARQPMGLSATATHDTKRGEDARARLYTIAEAPRLWADGVSRWREINRHFLTVLPDGPAPEPNVEWMLYQSLAGVWPDELDPAGLEPLRDRFIRYAEKAAREAKLRTNWSEPNDAYEKALTTYAGALLSDPVFLRDFDQTIKPFLAAGCINTLGQTLIKLTAPGIPDIYQSTEQIDLSLVDPDNRQLLDLQTIKDTLERDEGRTPGARKSRIIEKVLHFRREHAPLFARGAYRPLEIKGSRKHHIVAYARSLDDSAAIAIAPRLAFGCVDPVTMRISPDFWQDTAVCLPADLARPLRDLLCDRPCGGESLLVADILSAEDVALLVSSNNDNEV